MKVLGFLVAGVIMLVPFGAGAFANEIGTWPAYIVGILLATGFQTYIGYLMDKG